MLTKQYTDEELINMIRAGDAYRDKALGYIYMKWHLEVRRFLVAQKVRVIDTRDILHNSIIALDNNIRTGRYEHRRNCSLKTYFKGICKLQSTNGLEKSNRTILVKDNQSFDRMDERNPEVLMLEQELKDMVDSILNTLSKQCRELLLLFRLRYSMREIALELDFENAQQAKNKAYGCRQKMQKRIDRNPLIQKYLKGRNEK